MQNLISLVAELSTIADTNRELYITLQMLRVRLVRFDWGRGDFGTKSIVLFLPFWKLTQLILPQNCAVLIEKTTVQCVGCFRFPPCRSR
jgi:hypothetical protein